MYAILSIAVYIIAIQSTKSSKIIIMCMVLIANLCIHLLLCMVAI